MLAARYTDGSAMSDEELRDQLLTLVFAGYETTGVALSWALYWLEHTPDARARLLVELDALGPEAEPGELAACPYLEAVCNEALRLYPVVPEVIRKLERPLELMGYTLPVGVAVAACISQVHAREDVFSNASAFSPERFLGRRYEPLSSARSAAVRGAALGLPSPSTR
jgi:cytochrome P450